MAESVLMKHHEYSTEIEKWLKIRSHLINQVHKKKSTFRRGRYIISPGSNTERIYNSILFFGQSGLHNFNPYPCYFKGSMEEVMKKELQRPIDFDYTQVYYNVGGETNPFRDVQRRLLAFDTDEWQLSECPAMTDEDAVVIRNFMAGFTALLDKLNEALKALSAKDRTSTDRETARIKKRFSKFETLL
jgi:hypothetical protein